MLILVCSMQAEIKDKAQENRARCESLETRVTEARAEAAAAASERGQTAEALALAQVRTPSCARAARVGSACSSLLGTASGAPGTAKGLRRCLSTLQASNCVASSPCGRCRRVFEYFATIGKFKFCWGYRVDGGATGPIQSDLSGPV